MRQDRLTQIYQELLTMSVGLDQAPQLGLQYLSEKMYECRRKQDQVSDLLVEVNRDWSRVKHATRIQKTLVLTLRATNRAGELEVANRDLDGLEGEEDELRILIEAVKAKSSNLRMTSSDIRLLSANTEQLMKMGPVTPSPSTQLKKRPEYPEPAPQIVTELVPVDPIEENRPGDPVEETANSIELLLGETHAETLSPQAIVREESSVRELSIDDILSQM